MKKITAITILLMLVFTIFSGCNAQKDIDTQSVSSASGLLTLEITSPRSGKEIFRSYVTVGGIVSPPGARVSVSGVSVDVADDGRFKREDIPLEEGKNEIKVSATLDGETVSFTVAVNYTLKLDVGINLSLEPGRDWLTESPVEIYGRVSDSRAQVTFNDKEVEAGTDGRYSVMMELAEGKNTVTVTAKLGDQTATDTREVIYVPKVPLGISILTPQDGSAAEIDLVKVTGYVTDAGDEVLVNGAAVPVSAAGYFYSYVKLEEGENRIEAVAARGSQEIADTANVTYSAPDTAPAGTLALRIKSPAGNSAHRVNLLPVTGSVDAAGATVLVNGREAEVSADGSFQGLAVLEEGKNVIEVIALKDNLKTTKNIEVGFSSALSVYLEHPSSIKGIDYRKVPATFTGTVNKPEAKVTVDGKEVTVAPDGSFTAQVLLSESSKVTAVATLGNERDEHYVLTGAGENGGILTVPGYSIFFVANLKHEGAITLKAGETGRLPLTLDTRKDGPGRFYGSLFYVDQEYGKMPLAWPQRLDVYLEPSGFTAYPDTIYDFNLVFETSAGLAPSTYRLLFYRSFEGGFRGSSSIKVIVE